MPLSTDNNMVAFSYCVSSDLLSTNAESIKADLVATLQRLPGSSQSQTVELNLRAAKMVDSVGLNLLVWLIKSLREKNVGLRILISSPLVQRTLKFTRLDQHAEIVHVAK